MLAMFTIGGVFSLISLGKEVNALKYVKTFEKSHISYNVHSKTRNNVEIVSIFLKYASTTSIGSELDFVQLEKMLNDASGGNFPDHEALSRNST